jgi:hypothetical protein
MSKVAPFVDIPERPPQKRLHQRLQCDRSIDGITREIFVFTASAGGISGSYVS